MLNVGIQTGFYMYKKVKIYIECMIIYKNLSGKSGVESYEYDTETYSWIKVQFLDGGIYTYTDDTASWSDIITMCQLADDGIGLNSWINANQPGYL